MVLAAFVTTESLAEVWSQTTNCTGLIAQMGQLSENYLMTQNKCRYYKVSAAPYIRHGCKRGGS
jgi:hypothetical protein